MKSIFTFGMVMLMVLFGSIIGTSLSTPTAVTAAPTESCIKDPPRVYPFIIRDTVEITSNTTKEKYEKEIFYVQSPKLKKQIKVLKDSIDTLIVTHKRHLDEIENGREEQTDSVNHS